MREQKRDVIEVQLKKLKRLDLEAWLKSINDEYYQKLEERYGIRFEN